jgi:hypothetical protein
MRPAKLPVRSHEITVFDAHIMIFVGLASLFVNFRPVADGARCPGDSTAGLSPVVSTPSKPAS